MRYFSARFDRFLLIAIMVLALHSCGDPKLKYSVTVEPNPHEIAPLTANIHVNTELPATATAIVIGTSPVENSVETPSTNLTIPVLGLYPARTNKVQLTLDYGDSQVVDTVEIQSPYVPEYFPRIEIDKL